MRSFCTALAAVPTSGVSVNPAMHVASVLTIFVAMLPGIPPRSDSSALMLLHMRPAGPALVNCTLTTACQFCCATAHDSAHRAKRCSRVEMSAAAERVRLMSGMFGLVQGTVLLCQY